MVSGKGTGQTARAQGGPSILRAYFSYLIGMLVGSLLVIGCGAPNGGSIEQARQAFDRRDYAETIRQTEAYIRERGRGGEDTAAALYLQGRAYEEMQAANDAEAARNLAAARQAYVSALQLSPPQPLAARLRTGVANVAYFQEDYPTAIQQWTIAYEQTDLEDQKPWILYRIGLANQRLGNFDQADRLFAQVQQQYPNTEPANRARARQGHRAFHVQVGVFSQPLLANRMVEDLKSQGLAATISPDNQGRHVVLVGPASTWAAARQIQERLRPQYPDALIVP